SRGRQFPGVKGNAGCDGVGTQRDRSEVWCSSWSDGLLPRTTVGRSVVLGNWDRFAVGPTVEGDLDIRVKDADEPLGEVSTVLPVDSDDHCSAEDATASEADERPECLIVAEPDGLLHAVCLVCRFDREGPDGAEADARLRRPVLEPTRERQTAPQGRGRALCAREQLDGRQEGLQPDAGAECRLRCVVVNEL